MNTDKRKIRNSIKKISYNQMNPVQRKIRNIVNKLGYDIVQFRSDQMGQDPIRDMKKFLHDDRPLILDIGANEGQTLHRYRANFPKCTIHSFEPSPTTFKELKVQASGYKNVHLWNYALGSSPGQKTLLENSSPDMSSFLPLGNSGWGTITKETSVEIKTVDQFCREEKINFIDILKSDTQGFDLEVFKGAEGMFRSNKIGLVYFEITFSDMYKQQPSFTKEYDFLINRGFLLVSFYRFYYRKKLAHWTDALFAHKSYIHASS